MWRKILPPLALNLLMFAVLALSSHASIKLAQSAPAAPADSTFAVVTTTDAIDSNIGDNVCLATNGACTLRAAIQEANAQYAAHGGFYTITVPGAVTAFSPPRLYLLTQTGSGEDNAATGDLDIKSNLVILTKFGYPARISASGLGDRVFDIIQQPTTRTITVTINNLWLENGSGINYGGGLAVENSSHVTLNSVRVLTNTVTGQNVDGGGIDQRGGTLTLNNVLVRANHAQGGNNGSALGGGIYSFGKLSVNASTVLNNRLTSSAPTDNLSGYGGGIYVSCCVGVFDIKDSTVSGNSIVLGSAARFLIGGGINAGGLVTITRSIISGNSLTATGSNATVIIGGGLYIDNGRILSSTVTNNNISAANPSLGMYGGGLDFLSQAQMINSTIAFNSVRVGSAPAGYGGGISVGDTDYGTDLLLDRSIVLSNVANDGGGLSTNITTSLAVRNSLLEGNTATNGAGIFNVGVLSVTNATFYFNLATKSGGGIYDSAIANIDSVTFNNDKADFDSDNTGDGGGLFVGTGATLYLRNSLLTGNADHSVTTTLPDCAGTIISQNYNLIQQSSSPSGCNMIGSTSHDLHGTFPGVLDSAPQDNGGNTPTIALPPGSAAINAGDPTGCQDENGNPLSIDQRGFPRIRPCDIGAYEFMLQTFLPLIVR